MDTASIQDELDLVRAAFNEQEVFVDPLSKEFVVLCSSLTSITFYIPQHYPTIETLRMSINSSEFTKSWIDRWSDDVRLFITGGNSCFDIVQYVLTTYQTMLEGQVTSSSCCHISKNDDPTSKNIKLMQVLIYFHHIKSSTKKKEIVDSAHELDLGVLWKEGFPGIIIAEGQFDDVQEYIKRLQKLKWQHMVIRGERIFDDVTKQRQLPRNLELVEDMSKLGQLCEERGVHDLFMTIMKG